MTGTGGAVVRTVLDTGRLDAGRGSGGLLRRLVRVPPGGWYRGSAGPGGELWFVIAGAGLLEPAAGQSTQVGPDTGLWFPPGARYCLRAQSQDVPTRERHTQDGLSLDSVVLPATGLVDVASLTPGQEHRDIDLASRRLADCPEQVTGDRRFRVLFGPGRGCEAATQFVGEIPPGRAPEHTHPYDEVVLILEGEGTAHTGPGDQPLAPGSCVHLPPGRPHCLENTGSATLRVLGVFHPGGSPAAKGQASPGQPNGG
jgi:mannose-6-phosphate isomerase-like protein (cupin superfamily)